MKIGILTFHDGINHGAFLQAYCLQETIKAKGDFDEVKIINYKSKEHFDKEYKVLLFFSPFFRPLKKLGFLKLRFFNLLKLIKFLKVKKLFNLTSFSHDLNPILEKESFDYVILGSDEIWNFKNPLVGVDLAYYGVGIPAGTKVISYAPSFGSVMADDSIPEVISEAVRSLDSVSVRDSNSLQIVNKLNVEAEKVLDPTFLFDIKNKVTIKAKDYILVYLNYLDPKWIPYIQAFAEKTGKSLVAIGYSKDWCDKNVINLDPFEWVSYFANADYVITNTFHGTIYSVLNKKRFVVPNPGQKLNKISSLLVDLKLTDHLVHDPGVLESVISKTIDYEVVNRVIESMRESSLSYLSKALKSNENSYSFSKKAS